MTLPTHVCEQSTHSSWDEYVRIKQGEAIRILLSNLSVDKELADQVWEAWDKEEISDFWAAWAWWRIAASI